MTPAKSVQLFAKVEDTFLFSGLLILLSTVISKAVAFDWNTPHATFYGGSDASGTNDGACGYGNMFDFGYGTMTAALSGTLFNDGYRCGACYQLWCRGNGCYSSTNSIVVTATNLCPQGSFSGVCDYPYQHFDLAEPAFSQLADPSVGVFNVQYQRVKCAKAGGMKFNIQGHTYVFQVLVYNVGSWGDVCSVSVKGTNTEWITLTRGWGQNYNTGNVLDGQALSFTVTISDGSTITSWDVAGQYWQYGQTLKDRSSLELSWSQCLV